ncbi:hypothetical protein K0M31_000764 [Melipona bicolor]|uniref:Uncharacterized protein n=1 Tax=Melipona bicolor TaxID=60889 RepID=A0AA40GED1_9HYME|nr:hypothetical protein K0M31_000764 [Melipona bicolor]
MPFPFADKFTLLNSFMQGRSNATVPEDPNRSLSLVSLSLSSLLKRKEVDLPHKDLVQVQTLGRLPHKNVAPGKNPTTPLRLQSFARDGTTLGHDRPPRGGGNSNANIAEQEFATRVCSVCWPIAAFSCPGSSRGCVLPHAPHSRLDSFPDSCSVNCQPSTTVG